MTIWIGRLRAAQYRNAPIPRTQTAFAGRDSDGVLGKTAIITGAASGMGLLSSQQLAQGARVVLTDVNGEAARAAAADIRRQGSEAMAIAVDVRDYAQVKHAAERTREKYGSMNILINCAGGASGRVFGCTGGFWTRTSASLTGVST